MKKLMMVAAVAAMIGGAQADMVYDFTASVKTTKAKSGSSVTLSMKVGQDQNGDWWYNDDCFSASDTAGYLDFGTYTKVVKVNSSTGVGTLMTSRLDNDGKAALAVALKDYSNWIDPTTNDTYGEPEIYKGKEKWCASWSWKGAATCIRVKGSETIKATYAINSCCADMKFTQSAADTLLLGDIDILTLYRFGGVLGAKCMNVEMVASIGDGVSIDAAYKTIPAFALAGQGTWSTTQKNSLKVVDPGIASVSGYIVGIWYEAECEVCCGADASSLAYSCDLTQHNIATYTDDDAITGDDAAMGLADLYTVDQWGTAAYGSFTLKYNSKKSL